MRKSRTYRSPFIKKFRTRSSLYIYDANTNHILKVDPVVYSVVGDIHRLAPEEIVRKWSGLWRTG